MGTLIERVDISEAGWRSRHSALRLAVAAAKRCLHRAGSDADDIDLLINVGIYRDRNLGEPALAALIQEMIGANPDDPHTGEHGTFSFDVANGECGVLTALQIVDGFLRAAIIRSALIVASDANPGFGMSKHFPFSPIGAALLCRWNDGDDGLGPVRWSARTDGDGFSAHVGFRDGRNVLRFHESAAFDVDLAGVCALAVSSCLAESSLTLSDVAICVAPARQRFRVALAAKLGVPPTHLVVADDPRTHTAALPAALHRRNIGGSDIRPADTGPVLLVAGAAGPIAGAAVYRPPVAVRRNGSPLSAVDFQDLGQ
ncbi:3-oxoacyl-ACP synthase [Mycolicibacterium goodii]|uniref:3-oxoacyl-ACP synthase n=1 Tax=Mycolicibacterium goodii TaxID=134601 RepID=UPI001BDD42CA|nr:3-oxoacyl-ACP synthase [Mycolicibacterium goodii]MBU8811385.1 3-oxoacyl-ACP synthase [Mycolicibacterium goodii]MBU8831898.1 3-oxoacyl-ACP synthase [Mycolicibacterium goodii]ULN45438.1 3-oxoacyl-ACP synthase [Mycolicibacterium goodii]